MPKYDRKDDKRLYSGQEIETTLGLSLHTSLWVICAPRLAGTQDADACNERLATIAIAPIHAEGYSVALIPSLLISGAPRLSSCQARTYRRFPASGSFNAVKILLVHPFDIRFDIETRGLDGTQVLLSAQEIEAISRRRLAGFALRRCGLLR